MGGVGAEIDEERLVVVLHLVDEAGGVVEENIGAESLGGGGLAVVEIGAVEIGVVPIVRRLADAAAAVAQDLLEAAVFRAIGVIVAKVPLAEHASVVAGIAENRSQRDFVGAQHGTAHDGVPDARAIGPMSGQKRGSRRGAGGGDVVIGEADALSVQRVEIRRLQDRVSVAGEVAVALIVGDDQDDIGALGRVDGERADEEQEEGGQDLVHGGFGRFYC